jgi:DNA ligase-1
MNEKGMQHGRNWNGHKINGYIATEKYDGCRAFWDGENLWSRGGIKINLPDSWRAVLPLGIPLDGEIYDGIDGLYRCGAAIKYGNFTASMCYMVFDCPTAEGEYCARLDFAAKYAVVPLEVVTCKPVSNLSKAKELLFEVISHGGEGLMLRNPKLKYAAGRTAELLKFKNIM